MTISLLRTRNEPLADFGSHEVLRFIYLTEHPTELETSRHLGRMSENHCAPLSWNAMVLWEMSATFYQGILNTASDSK